VAERYSGSIDTAGGRPEHERVDQLTIKTRWQRAPRAALLVAVCALWGAAPAQATFPGVNGSLAYSTPSFSFLAAPSIYTTPLGGKPDPGTQVPDSVRLVGDAFDVRWSPDARRIAFTSTRDGNPEIYTLDVKEPNATPRRLTFDAGFDVDPSWSPDGARIAFTSTRGGSFDIWVMNAADGSGLSRLTTDPAVDQQAEFAPTGDRLAFESDRGGVRQLYLMAGDGSGQTRLTNLRDTSTDANWSPDGNQIAFSTGTDSVRDIAVVAAAGGEPRRLTTGDSTYQFPAWSPDGRQIAFNSERSGPAIYVIDAPDATGAGGGGEPQVLTYAPAFGGIFAVGGVDADWGNLPPVAPTAPAPETAAITASPEVLVQPPGADSPKPIADAVRTDPADLTRQVPLGTKIIATRGPETAPRFLDVSLTASLGRGQGTASVDARGGVYQMRREGRGRRAALDLRLRRPLNCRPRARTAQGPTAEASRFVDVFVRRHRGRVQTSTGWTTARGRGTAWTMRVECNRVIVRVREGTVIVTDRRRDRTITLRGRGSSAIVRR
jgi:hypothetical protein